jgi:heme/copper-type cytochrome/quinol oxidase subunit 4
MPSSALILVAIAVILIGVSLRDFLHAADALTPARRIWLRVAFIFAGIAVALQVVPMLLR